MPATPIHALPYPSPDDPGGDFPADLAALAGAADAALGGVVPDSGVVGTLGLTVDAGWTLVTKQHRLTGKVMYLYLRLTRAGAAIAANAIGDIPDTIVCTVTDTTLRPAMPYWAGFYRASFTGGAALIVGSTGVLQITTAHSGSTIATGDTLICACTYTIP